MGSEQSLLKVVASAKKRQDTALIFRGDIIDTKWIPEEDLLQMKLETLKLIDMRFVTVPSIMFQLLSIKQLDLSSNMLVSVTGIGALLNLTDLDLSGNHLDYLPDDLANCENLSFLNVSQNMLNIRSLPLSFFDGKLFLSLDISENKFTKMTPELITLLGLTESVSIHSNPWDVAELKDVQPSTAEEHVKALLKILKSKHFKETTSPPSVPPPRSDMAKLSAGPPPVASRSPAAVAPSRTQDALKTPARPAGPKGRKLPTNDFIDNNAHEDEIEVVSNKPKEKAIKTEAFLPSFLLPTDAILPAVPSKLSRPSSALLSPTEEESATARESILVKEPILMKEAIIKKEVNGKEKDAFKQDLKDQTVPLPSPKLPKKNFNTFTNSNMHSSNPKTWDVEQFAIDTCSEAIDFPEPLKRQATLTESSKFETITPEQEAEVPIKKFGPKKPVGGVSLFGGAIMPNYEDTSKKSPEAPAIPSKKSEVNFKENSAVQANIPIKEMPDANTMSPSPKMSRRHDFSLTPSNTSVSGKKPPIGGVSMFGPMPVPSAGNTENNKAEIREENQTGSLKEALNSRDPTSPSSKKTSIFSMFNISPSSPSTTESKEIMKTNGVATGSSTQQAMSKKIDFSPQPQPNSVLLIDVSPPKKSPAGRFSMLGGPVIFSEASKKEGNESQGTATWKKPQPGGAGGSMFDKQNTDGNLESELRGRLKQQSSIASHIDSPSAPLLSPKPNGTTLPRSFKPSDADQVVSAPPLPSKPSAAKSVNKLASK